MAWGLLYLLVLQGEWNIGTTIVKEIMDKFPDPLSVWCQASTSKMEFLFSHCSALNGNPTVDDIAVPLACKTLTLL